MTREEAKAKIDALSPETKRWLRDACDQIADCGEYCDSPKARAECVAAGLVEMTRAGKWMEVEAPVMGLVYSDGYLNNA